MLQVVVVLEEMVKDQELQGLVDLVKLQVDKLVLIIVVVVLEAAMRAEQMAAKAS
jgi:hypothetical protein